MLENALAVKIDRGLSSMSLVATEQQRQQLQQYLHLLHKWNGHFNLVADSNPDELLSRHLLDSLSISQFITGKLIMDLGSGAGLPGIPLAIVHPHRKFVLLDSNGKKTRFLFQTCVELQLHNVRIENCRVEHYQSSGQIDIVTSRAFSTLQDTVALVGGLLGKRGRLLAMKGRFPEAELAKLPPDFSAVRTVRLRVPGADAERHLVEIAATGSAG